MSEDRESAERLVEEARYWVAEAVVSPNPRGLPIGQARALCDALSAALERERGMREALTAAAHAFFSRESTELSALRMREYRGALSTTGEAGEGEEG